MTSGVPCEDGGYVPAKRRAESGGHVPAKRRAESGGHVPAKRRAESRHHKAAIHLRRIIIAKVQFIIRATTVESMTFTNSHAQEKCGHSLKCYNSLSYGHLGGQLRNCRVSVVGFAQNSLKTTVI